MYRLGLACALTQVAACQYAFGVPGPDALPDATSPELVLVQQAVATNLPTDVTSLVVSLAAPTQEGATLVLAVGIRTNSETITDIDDDGNNVWIRAVTSVEVPSSPTTATRVEIWFVSGARPVTTLTITESALRTTGVNLTEWSGLSPSSTLLERVSARSDASELVTPGELSVSSPALLLGVVAFEAPTPPALQTPSFQPLMPVGNAAGSDLYISAAYAPVLEGTGSVQWAFTPATRWSSALIALRRE